MAKKLFQRGSIKTAKVLRGALFIVRARNNIIKADFVHNKKTTFPTKTKIGIHLDELRIRQRNRHPLLLECSPIRKADMFESADLYRTNWRKCYIDVFSCYHT